MKMTTLLSLFVITLSSFAVETSPESPSSDDRDSKKPSEETDSVGKKKKSFFDQFKDADDGKLDMSDWLINKDGFLPVPIIVTEPAVGYGGGVALAFFHRKEEDLWIDGKPDKDGNKTRKLNPPSLSGIGGAYTENGTWAIAGGHRGIWKEDTWRYTGALAYFSANLTYYGPGGILGSIGGLEYNNKGIFLDQMIERRIGSSDFFIGAGYKYMNFDNTFSLGSNIPGISPREFQSSNAGGSLLATYDSRDNPMSPSSGLFARAEFTVYDEAIAGDFDYLYLGLTSLKYWKLAPKWDLGWRVQGEFTDGDVPFYAKPFVQLRGVPAMRYQGRQVVETELELRWNFYKRYSALAFGGVGWAALKVSDIPDVTTVYSRGFGLRYLIAKKLGLQTGIDFGWGPDDFAFYLVVGSAWMR